MKAQRHEGTEAQRGWKMARRAFTLVELLLVLVILAVLAAVVLPKFVGRSEQARQAAAKSQIAIFKTSLNAFEIDVGRYPTTEEGISALVEAPAGVKEWKAPGYMDSVPKDPWGNPYHYISPGTKAKAGYDVWSSGPDGADGTADDIGNWVE